MTEYSRMAKGSYIVSGGTLGVSAPSVKVINLPFVPDYVELINYTQAITPAQHGIPFAFWDASVPPVTVSSVQYDTIAEVFNATPVLTTDSVRVGGGISAFSAGLALQYGARKQIIGATKANPVVFNVTAHGYSVGDIVVLEGLYQSSSTGMPQIAGMPFRISAVTDADHFSIVWDATGSNYTALSGSPVGSFVKKVLYPYLYEPGVNFIEAITLGTTTTIVTTTPHNYVVGQEIAFRIPNAWGTIELNSLPNVQSPGSPIYGYVVSVTDNQTFVCSINSSSYSAFVVNQPVTSVPGLTFPQVVAVGDVNTGGTLISSGSPLYPSPEFPTSTLRVPTINGPAIRGAFVNNTSAGFVIGAGASRTDTTSFVGGSDGDRIEWRAYLHDYSSP